MTTLNNLILIFQDIAKRHNQVNDFECSQDFNIAADDAPTYPIIVVNPTGANLPKTDAGYTSFSTTFDFQCIDLVSKDNSNRNDVLSDTMQIINDCVSELSQHPYYNENSIDLINNVSFEPLRGKYDEDVDGWKISLELQTPNKVSWCGAPMETLNGFTPPSSLDATVENSTASFRVEVPAGTTKVLDDEQLQLVNVNGDLIQAYTNPLYEDLLIEVPVFGAKSGILYRYPLFQGQQISYAVGDAGWHFQNGTYDYVPPSSPETIAALDLNAANPFTTLKENNVFGNKERFTDELGTQVYANEVIVCHLTGLMYLVRDANTGSQFSEVNWATSVSNANSYVHNNLNYSDWRLTNNSEYLNLINYQNGVGLFYSPFTNFLSGSTFRVWMNNTNVGNSNVGIRGISAQGLLINHTKTSITQYMLVRNHLI